MSGRRSAFTAVAVLGAFSFLYALAIAVPVYVPAVNELWSERGHAGFGDVLARMVAAFSFLPGSAVVSDGFPVAPASWWPGVVFVVLLATLVHAALRTASEDGPLVALRVLCAGVLAGGLTNLFVAVQSVLEIRGGLKALPSIIWALPEDGIWLGLVVGLLGGYVAWLAAVVGRLASVALGTSPGTGGSGAVPSSGEPFGWGRAAQVATWGALPLLVLTLVGGFVWDYDADADPYGAEIGSGEAWVRLAWFAHARLSPPADPYSLGGTFETWVWLPRTLTSVALLVLVWLVLLVLVRGLREGRPGAVSVVVQCWGLVAVLAAVVGLVEGALLTEEDDLLTAHYWALEIAADGIRFGACFGWTVGLAVVLAHRFSRPPAPVVAEPVLEGSAR